jgi:hypothetical protein
MVLFMGIFSTDDNLRRLEREKNKYLQILRAKVSTEIEEKSEVVPERTITEDGQNLCRFCNSKKIRYSGFNYLYCSTNCFQNYLQIADIVSNP